MVRVCAGVCMLVCVCECTGVCMCVRCYVYVCAHVHTGQNKVSSSFSSFTLIPFFKESSLGRSRSHPFTIQGARPGPTNLWVAQVNAGDPSSGPHAYRASILPTESSPQAQIKGLSAIKSYN